MGGAVCLGALVDGVFVNVFVVEQGVVCVTVWYVFDDGRGGC